MSNLDVGAGHNPRGNVNIDIFDTFSHYSANFIKASGCYLPFRNKAFNETTCIHVIEHVKTPLLLIKEIVRVTHGKITIKTPYRNINFSYFKSLVSAGKSPHLWSFTKTWFIPLQEWFPNTEIYYSQFFVIPLEITVELNTTYRRR
ncbi:MAG: class I SAM-dependent methyltransferase [Candidatus Bathyarchaeota archaeon]|nr:class I SAM-dependent methyltransferase [Candidatus Bathyarchaeota archaeon]